MSQREERFRCLGKAKDGSATFAERKATMQSGGDLRGALGWSRIQRVQLFAKHNRFFDYLEA
jgi:hypothetical protein